MYIHIYCLSRCMAWRCLRALASSGQESFEQQRPPEGSCQPGQHSNPVEEHCPEIVHWWEEASCHEESHGTLGGPFDFHFAGPKETPIWNHGPGCQGMHGWVGDGDRGYKSNTARWVVRFTTRWKLKADEGWSPKGSSSFGSAQVRCIWSFGECGRSSGFKGLPTGRASHTRRCDMHNQQNHQIRRGDPTGRPDDQAGVSLFIRQWGMETEQQNKQGARGSHMDFRPPSHVHWDAASSLEGQDYAGLLGSDANSQVQRCVELALCFQRTKISDIQ